MSKIVKDEDGLFIDAWFWRVLRIFDRARQ